jgi:hypothetical protein
LRHGYVDQGLVADRLGYALAREAKLDAHAVHTYVHEEMQIYSTQVQGCFAAL